jgi:hypothetical protein
MQSDIGLQGLAGGVQSDIGLHIGWQKRYRFAVEDGKSDIGLHQNRLKTRVSGTGSAEKPMSEWCQ